MVISVSTLQVDVISYRTAAMPPMKATAVRLDSRRGSFASCLEQVANLRCAPVNSAFYPQRDGK